jgi:hypothetical protein
VKLIINYLIFWGVTLMDLIPSIDLVIFWLIVGLSSFLLFFVVVLYDVFIKYKKRKKNQIP